MNEAVKTIQVVGLGAGGHAKVLIEILRADGRYEIIGLLDSNAEMLGQTVLGVEVLGGDEMLEDLSARGLEHFFIGLGGGANTRPRRRLYESARAVRMRPVSAIHPNSIVSPSAQIGEGATIMPSAIINACAHLGENVIINSGAIIEHDCTVGDHAHVATGARLAGQVSVGAGAHIGIGASVRQSINIGAGAIVGAGAVVVRDVPKGVVVAGVPARYLRKVEE